MIPVDGAVEQVPLDQRVVHHDRALERPRHGPVVGRRRGEEHGQVHGAVVQHLQLGDRHVVLVGSVRPARREAAVDLHAGGRAEHRAGGVGADAGRGVREEAHRLHALPARLGIQAVEVGEGGRGIVDRRRHALGLAVPQRHLAVPLGALQGVGDLVVAVAVVHAGHAAQEHRAHVRVEGVLPQDAALPAPGLDRIGRFREPVGLLGVGTVAGGRREGDVVRPRLPREHRDGVALGVADDAEHQALRVVRRRAGEADVREAGGRLRLGVVEVAALGEDLRDLVPVAVQAARDARRQRHDAEAVRGQPPLQVEGGVAAPGADVPWRGRLGLERGVGRGGGVVGVDQFQRLGAGVDLEARQLLGLEPGGKQHHHAGHAEGDQPERQGDLEQGHGCALPRGGHRQGLRIRGPSGGLGNGSASIGNGSASIDVLSIDGARNPVWIRQFPQHPATWSAG